MAITKCPAQFWKSTELGTCGIHFFIESTHFFKNLFPVTSVSKFLCQSYLKNLPSNQINLTENAKKSFFIIEKVKKYHKCPALHSTKKNKKAPHHNPLVLDAHYSESRYKPFSIDKFND